MMSPRFAKSILANKRLMIIELESITYGRGSAGKEDNPPATEAPQQ